ncbi:hypothetical protein Ga0100230_010380 [Opitutaceae bacterium TAV3]|nr:hypothetical protein Ga0100230_010380 [Opitutaceae bacterium TAV3]
MNHPRRLLRFRSFLQSRQAILDTGRLLAIAMIAGFGGTHLAAGATLLVAPADATISASENPGSISDGANGATPPPLYRSIQSAIDHARPGDIIQVSPGVYHENLQFPHSGRPAEPITLTGAPGAIIDGGTTQKLDWQPAPDIAPGVWRTPIDFPVFTIAANGKLVTTLDEKRTDPDREHRPRDNIRWPDAFRNGIGPSGWDGVKALALYRRKARELLLRFQGDLDPRTIDLAVAPRTPLITIKGASHIVIRGLALRNAAYGVHVTDATDIVVEQCAIGPIDFGVHLDEGSERVTIRHNEIWMAPYAGADPRQPGQWDAWSACKNGGFYDRYAVRICNSRGHHEVHDNLVRDHWDGIESGAPGTPEQNPDVHVHHNRLVNIFDDAFETSGGQIGSRWHDNIIENSRVAIRIKDPAAGPLYIYRNLFLNNQQDIRNYAGSKGAVPGVEVWVYHNTSTSIAAYNMNYVAGTTITTNGFHFLNNLYWTRAWLHKANSSKTAYPPPDWLGDYNLYARSTVAHPRPGETPFSPNDLVSLDKQWTEALDMARIAGRDTHSLWLSPPPPPALLMQAQATFHLKTIARPAPPVLISRQSPNANSPIVSPDTSKANAPTSARSNMANQCPVFRAPLPYQNKNYNLTQPNHTSSNEKNKPAHLDYSSTRPCTPLCPDCHLDRGGGQRPMVNRWQLAERYSP